MAHEIRVLLVEPVAVVSYGLGAMATSIPEVRDWRRAASLAEARSLMAGAPPVDAVIVSAAVLAGASADEAAAVRSAPTVVLVPSAEPRDLEVATGLEASGYLVVPDVTTALLREALFDAVAGRMALPPPVASHLLKRARGDDPVVVSRAVRLSPREEDVLELVVAGMSNQQIAHELAISIHGVKRHVSSILSKHNSPSRAHLVSRVIRSGLVNGA